MPQVVSSVTVASGSAEIIIVCVRKSFGNGTESLQPVPLFPDLPTSVFFRHLDLIFPHHASQDCPIRLLIVGKIFQVLRDFLNTFPLTDPLLHLFHIVAHRPVAVEGAAGISRCVGQQIHPANVRLCAVGIPVILIGLCQGKFRYAEIYPVDIINLRSFLFRPALLFCLFGTFRVLSLLHAFTSCRPGRDVLQPFLRHCRFYLFLFVRPVKDSCKHQQNQYVDNQDASQNMFLSSSRYYPVYDLLPGFMTVDFSPALSVDFI